MNESCHCLALVLWTKSLAVEMHNHLHKFSINARCLLSIDLVVCLSELFERCSNTNTNNHILVYISGVSFNYVQNLQYTLYRVRASYIHNTIIQFQETTERRKMEQKKCSLVSTTDNTILFALLFLLSLSIAWHRNIEINTIYEMESLSFIVISISKWCGRFRINVFSFSLFKRREFHCFIQAFGSVAVVDIAIVWQLYHFHLLQFVALGFLNIMSQRNDDAILANKFNNIW